MSEPFVAEIRILPYNFPPQGWADCNGQLLAISQNTALFSLVGTMYGGNGQTTFGLPNLQDRIPVGFGQGPGLSNYDQGQTAGTSNITLLQSQMPQHNHGFGAFSNVGDSTNPANSVPARVSGETPYVNAVPNTPLATTISPVGGNQPHNNLMPYLTLRFCIALIGVFPARQ
jgi:microcystin-dependent protein